MLRKAKPGLQFKLFFRFLSFIFPYRKAWSLILILSGLGMLFSLINPYFSKFIVDNGIVNKDLKTFIVFALLTCGIFIVNGIINLLEQFLDRYLKAKVNFDLNKRVFNHLQHLSFNYFTNKSTGEHLYKISYDIERVTNFITTAAPEAISLFLRLILILVVVLHLNWRMAVFSLILAPFLYLPNFYFVRNMRVVWQDLIENYQAIFNSLTEYFHQIQLIKAFGKERQTLRRYLKMLVKNMRIKIKNIKLEIFSEFAAQSLNRIILGLIAFYGGYLLIKDDITLGSLTAIMVYLSQLIGLGGKFAYFFQTSALGLVSCQRLAEVLDEKATVLENREAREIKLQNGRIAFKDVSFGYRPDEPVLKRISFIIEEGSFVALVGPSGYGKTTIINLILRLYDPSSGDIIIAGQNIKGLKFNSLREQVGVVLQEPFLWNDDIENNIRYGRPKATQQEIIELARVCRLDDFVGALPKKYKTIIGENACKISEGQKQKIAIARALAKRPRILILDEAMASMDSESEGKILSNIRETQKDLTLIVVSHRLSTVRNMGLVYYLESSDKIIIDTPNNLLESNQSFSKLFVDQR